MSAWVIRVILAGGAMPFTPDSGQRTGELACQLSADIVEKLVCCGSWLLLIHSTENESGGSVDDGRSAGDAGELVYQFRLDDHIPADHMLRAIDRFVDLDGLRRRLAPFYSTTGRPSVDPELTIRMLLVGYCFGIRSERRLCDEFLLAATAQNLRKLAKLIVPARPERLATA